MFVDNKIKQLEKKKMWMDH